jgi:tRNA-dihydrouridine synthase
MNNEQLPIHFAPLQGYTDAIYRSAHARIFGGIDSYYTPFVRLEHGDFRRKDVRELDADNNRGVNLTPQLIASTPEKILRILALFIEKGYKNVDINLGCPFPTLAKRHNGAGLLPYPDEVKALLMAAIEAHPEIQFSVKMRLGWEDANECMALLPLLNSLPLSHITMHPRLGKQQYKGEVDLEAFQRFYAECEKPLIYNGDLRTPATIHAITTRFPQLAGVMIGRGLLARPSLAREYSDGTEWQHPQRLALIKKMHEHYHAHLSTIIPSEAQLLTKVRTFWEYLEEECGRKAWKKIMKAGSMRNYLNAINELN